MEYTVQTLAELAGVSARTLRWYDRIGLLQPGRRSESGYRLYSTAEVDRLQQILFYRELDMPLDEIRQLLDHGELGSLEALQKHHRQLLSRRERLDRVIVSMERTMARLEGSVIMTDKEKFAAFKENLVAENEEKFGREVRARYGDAAMDASNRKVLQRTEPEHQDAVRLEQEVLAALAAAMDSGRSDSEQSRRLVELHRQWLLCYWKKYTKQAHAALARMYVEDERFCAYYDQAVKPGAARFLRDAILEVTGTSR